MVFRANSLHTEQIRPTLAISLAPLIHSFDLDTSAWAASFITKEATNTIDILIAPLSLNFANANPLDAFF